MLTEKPKVQEKFADNGEHSHFELFDTFTGVTLWSESEESNSATAIVRQGDLPADVLLAEKTKELVDVVNDYHGDIYVGELCEDDMLTNGITTKSIKALIAFVKEYNSK